MYSRVNSLPGGTPQWLPTYDDGIVRQLVEQITVVDAETIHIKFRYSDIEIKQTMC